MKVVGMLGLSEELCWQLMDVNGIIRYLEDGSMSNKIILFFFLNVNENSHKFLIIGIQR